MGDALLGRVAIVTGAAHGLGRAYAHRLAAAGAAVAVVDVAADAAERTVAELAAVSGPDRVMAVACDVTDEAAVTDMVRRVTAAWEGPLVLVNNAGGALLPAAPSETMRRQDWDRVLDVNLTGQWLCASAVVPTMRSQGYGKIVNIASSMVTKGWPLGLSPYMAAKAGVVGLTRALAKELGVDGIRVNAMAPGYVPVPTPGKVTHASAAEPRLRARILEEQCLPRTLVPEDLCGPIEFLASADSDAVTGQVLNVDGGWAMAT